MPRLADIKTAYKETAQILHPDRFATNKKLQDRATEQFKNLQEAYEYLTSGKGSRTKAGRAASATRAYGPGGQAEARLAGIAAARTQLVHQRDVVYDERRNGLVMAGIGAVVAILLPQTGAAAHLGHGRRDGRDVGNHPGCRRPAHHRARSTSTSTSSRQSRRRLAQASLRTCDVASPRCLALRRYVQSLKAQPCKGTILQKRRLPQTSVNMQ